MLLFKELEDCLFLFLTIVRVVLRKSKEAVRSINESRNSLGNICFSSSRNNSTASAIDGGVKKKIHSSGTTTLIISNEEINDIMKIVQALEDSNILLKRVTKTIKNKTK